MSKADPIPSGFRTVTPHIVVKGGAEAIDFYRRAFGAEELYRHVEEKSGLIMNASIRIGDSIIMLNDEMPEWGCLGPAESRPSSVTIHLYVENVDRVFDQAVSAGAEPVMPVSDTFWGDRYGTLQDPFGHRWSVATHIEDLSSEEIVERAAAAFA